MEYANPQTLVAKRIGITEIDVQASTSIIQLLNWQIEVSKDVENISAQLRRQEITTQQTGDYGDPVWMQKAHSSMELLKLFREKINVRVMELKENKNETAHKFMEAARQHLDGETFFDLLMKAEK
jgi:hypothetical protein